MSGIPADWRLQSERVLARARRFDRHLPAWLQDSPLSRLGFLWGCAVGWIWGTLWSRGRIERHGELWVFRGMPGWTYGRGGVCVGHCFLTGDGPLRPEVLQHESVHVRQWRRFGFLMPLMYLVAGRNPLRNRFEIEAGLEDGGYVPRG